MVATNLTDLQFQVQKYWSPLFSKQLRSNLMLGSLVSREYSGSISAMGDTVRINQVNAPTGQLLTLGTNADSFAPEKVATQYVDLKADKRAVASVEFESSAQLQSMLSAQHPEVVESLQYALAKQVNDYLYSLVIASSVGPDHQLNLVTDFNATQLLACRKLAAQAKWAADGGWYALMDPSYYSDVLASQVLTSSDFGATDAPVIGGQVATKRYGWNILEDNSRPEDTAILFHPSFMNMVTQQEVQIKISDLHANLKFGVVLSVDMVFGAALSINGNKKCITVTAA